MKFGKEGSRLFVFDNPPVVSRDVRKILSGAEKFLTSANMVRRTLSRCVPQLNVPHDHKSAESEDFLGTCGLTQHLRD
jgi:hypothetical protein